MKLLVLLLLSFSISLCHGIMPHGYDNNTEYIANHRLVSLAYNLESQQAQNDSNEFINYLDQCFFNHTFYSYVDQICDIFDKNNSKVPCVGALLVSHDDQSIILIYRGTTTQTELMQEEDYYNMTVAFPGGGTVHKFYYNAFTILWNSGLRDALFSAKNAYPSYELWVTGLSLGGGLSSISAAYISQLGYFNPNNMKLLNFGAMRVGKQDFVDRYPSLVPWAYRIVHRYDIVPHWFQQAGYLNYHNEIWYNNTMNGEGWVECDTVGNLNCSDGVPESDWIFADHQYFRSRGCIKFTSPNGTIVR